MKKIIPVCTLFFLCLGIAFCANLIQSDPSMAQAAGEAQDPLFRILGSGKEALGDLVFLRADSYLHGGLRGDLLDATRQTGERLSNEGTNDYFKHFLASDWAGKIYNQVNVTEHQHLTGEKSKEMLPLLAVSTSLNPHNIAAVLSTAYWVETALKSGDNAVEFLEKSKNENPDSWEIDFELGRIYFEEKKDFGRAAGFFESAVKKLDRNKGAEYTFFDPVRARYYLAEAYSKANDRVRALIFYREALRSYPAGRESALKAIIQKKMIVLEAGIGVSRK